MYAQVTDRARRVMQLANEEAQRLQHHYIGSEDILLGLVKEGSGVAVKVLDSLGVEPLAITREVEALVQKSDPAESTGKIPQAPRAKKVIEYAMEEASNLNHVYVGTEHILLGLLRDDVGVAAVVLRNLGLQPGRVRMEIQATLERAEAEGNTAFSPKSRIRWHDEPTEYHVYPVDEATTHRACQLVEEIAALQRAMGDAVGNQDFSEARQLRDKRDAKRSEFHALGLPAWVRDNVERLAGAEWTKYSHYPVLDLLRDDAGEPDPRALSLLPNPLLPPVKIVVGMIPRFPVSTVKSVLALDDIGSPYFQALVPLISPESVARATRKDHHVMVRVAFKDIERAAGARPRRPVLLCAVRPTLLSQDVRDELLAGLRRTNCDFVVFEAEEDASSLLGNLPAGTNLLEAPDYQT